jgi:hypothetical protein
MAKVNQFFRFVRAWHSLLLYWLGRSVWMLAAATLITCCGLLAHTYYSKQSTSTQQSLESLQATVSAAKQNRLMRARQIERPAQSVLTVTTNLDLPTDDAAQVAPLERYLREQLTRGIDIKQIDYQWERSGVQAGGLISGRPAKTTGAVKKVDVTIQLVGDYPALRAWLGNLLLQAPYVQLTTLQVQRVSKDQSQVACQLSLAVFYRPSV